MDIRTALLFATVALATSLAGCGQSITGRLCDTEDPCPEPYHCLPDRFGDARCMADCSEADTTLCSDGSFCVGAGASSACWLGGGTAIGSMCVSNTECVRGGLCVGLVGTTMSECFQGCNNIGGQCPSGGTCQMTLQGNGFCSR